MPGEKEIAAEKEFRIEFRIMIKETSSGESRDAKEEEAFRSKVRDAHAP